MLIGARAVQGVGGAIVSAVALSLIVTLFTEPAERAKAMGVFGFVAAGGGSIGVLLGGVLTDALAWNWIFLVNVPIGIAVVVFSLLVLPAGRGFAPSTRLDVAGAVTVTASLMVAVYAIVNGNEVGWATPRTLGLLGVAGVLLGVFLLIESRVPEPLMPLRLFRLRNLSISSVVGVLWAAAMFAWFFLSALYMQLVLGYTPLEVGLAFLPGNLIMAVFSLGLSARLVMRFGIRMPLGVGLGFAALGLLLFARAPVDGSFVVDVLPSMILLGLGAGMAFNPVLLAAMGDVPQEEAGPRFRCRQHRLHDGRRARPRRARESRGDADGDARRFRQRRARSPGGRLPRRLPRRRDLRGGGGRTRRRFSRPKPMPAPAHQAEFEPATEAA